MCVELLRCGMACAVQDGAGPAAQRYRGPVHAVRKIMAQEGWRAFYKGLAPAIIGSGNTCTPHAEGRNKLPHSPTPPLPTPPHPGAVRACPYAYTCSWPVRHTSMLG